MGCAIAAARENPVVELVCDMELIAEIGLNHGGDVSVAEELIWGAKSAGADTAKFQIYETSERVSANHPVTDELDRCRLSNRDLTRLINVCAEAGINFLTTAFGHSSLSLAAELGLERIKLASFSVSDEVLVNLAVEMEMEVIVSTGTATAWEIQKCNSILAQSPKNHTFLHCISEYPVSNASHLNLINIQNLRDTTGRTVGFSDHSIGSEAIFCAALMGAEVFEKHFSTDRSRVGVDQLMSADIAGLRECSDQIERATRIRGQVRDSAYWFERDASAFKKVSSIDSV